MLPFQGSFSALYVNTFTKSQKRFGYNVLLSALVVVGITCLCVLCVYVQILALSPMFNRGDGWWGGVSRPVSVMNVMKKRKSRTECPGHTRGRCCAP